MASVSRILCCPFRSCCCSGSQSCLESGLHYQSGGDPKPKRFSFLGIFWLQVNTKLQERLLQGLFVSVLYLLIYVWVISMVRKFEICRDVFSSMESHMGCIVVLFRKLSAAMALVVYIPSLC